MATTETQGVHEPQIPDQQYGSEISAKCGLHLKLFSFALCTKLSVYILADTVQKMLRSCVAGAIASIASALIRRGSCCYQFMLAVEPDSRLPADLVQAQ